MSHRNSLIKSSNSKTCLAVINKQMICFKTGSEMKTLDCGVAVACLI